MFVSFTGIVVLYASNHSDHSMLLKHIPLTLGERRKIAGMISGGVQFEDILGGIRNKVSSTEISRIHLLQRRDLNNIAHEFRISKSRHIDDAESVRLWVEQCREEKSGMVRFIKFEGEEAEDAFSQDGRIALDDFMIVLMNDVQVHLLQMYGHHRVNCIDSTHKTNGYNFQLTTLLIIDNNGEGFPVAFCISSKLDTSVMEVFLEHVRIAIGGCVEGAILISDNAPAYVDAWRTVMGPPSDHVLCTWHIDRSWRKNIAKIKQSPEVKAQVYKVLRVVLEAENKDEFECLLESTLRDMEAYEGTAEFLTYFRREYASRPEMWAHCYQFFSLSKHNLHLEAFHRTLKHIFMQGRKVWECKTLYDFIISLYN